MTHGMLLYMMKLIHQKLMQCRMQQRFHYVLTWSTADTWCRGNTGTVRGVVLTEPWAGSWLHASSSHLRRKIPRGTKTWFHQLIVKSSSLDWARTTANFQKNVHPKWDSSTKKDTTTCKRTGRNRQNTISSLTQKYKGQQQWTSHSNTFLSGRLELV